MSITMNWIYYYAVFIVATISVTQVSCTGLFELRLKSFRNEYGKNDYGECCTGRPDIRTGKCSGTCRTRFRVCLKHYQAKIDLKTECTFGVISTPVLGGNVIDILNRPRDDFVNPIRFPFEFAWPGTFTMIIEALHDDNETTSRSNDVLISRLPMQRVLDISSEWTENINKTTYSTIEYDIRVTCDSNYYGSGCANFCRPRNDSFGHYTCSPSGDRLCYSGWQGDYCSSARCRSGCDEKHGHCSKPNECQCQPGWKGPNCNECELYPGCVHGTCKEPWACVCNEGWGGLFCNQDLNYCTNHRPCQNGGTCFNTGQGSYTCECPVSFNGSDCEISSNDCSNAPCLNGAACHDDPNSNMKYYCECRKGFTGAHCEIESVTCSDNPCVRGRCRDTLTDFKCECPPGVSGKRCDTQIDECNPNPCENGGLCLNKDGTFQCSCPSGYTGSLCEENIDDCSGNSCRNGGTCVDMINQFRCQCVPGFIGSLCDEIVDLCLTKPCANGGSCTNLNNDYSCACRPGFTGKDCSKDIDECVSSPCQNRGTCVNRVNSFQCVCPSGFRGTHCELESYSPIWNDGSLSRHVSSSNLHEARSKESDGLSNGQVVLIAVLSVAMPTIVIVATMVVVCMKRRRKRDQEKDDAEARKQNEQNASHTMSHHQNSMSTKRGSNTTIGLDTSHHNMIKNTWDKSVNNISSSISVDECLMNTSIYGGISNYSDNTDCAQIQPLQRARSQKQLNTDPIHKQRASQILSKDYYNQNESKRISLLSDGTLCPSMSQQPTQQRWGIVVTPSPQSATLATPTPLSGIIVTSTTRQIGHCSPPHM